MSEEHIRIDKWLWFARFFKSRTLAGKLCAGGRIRLNGTPINKSHQMVKPGDVLTFPQGREIRVVKVIAAGVRRGPAAEAQTLYEDLDPPAEKRPAAGAVSPQSKRDRGTGRPTKAERRAIDR